MHTLALLLPLALAGSTDTPRVLWTTPISSHSFGSGAIADADGDGNLDVAFASYFGDAKVRVLRGKDGSELWSYHDPDPKRDDCYDASLRFADLGDGKLSLVVPCSSGCRVLAFDAATGAVKWNTYLGDGECIDTPPWIGTIDGALRVVVGTFKGRLHVIDGRTPHSVGPMPSRMLLPRARVMWKPPGATRATTAAAWPTSINDPPCAARG